MLGLASSVSFNSIEEVGRACVKKGEEKTRGLG